MNEDKEAKPDQMVKQSQVDAVNEFVDRVIPWKDPTMKFFNYAHLPEGKMRDVSALCASLARTMNELCPDGIQKTAGMQDLLRAKDCFVRSVLP